MKITLVGRPLTVTDRGTHTKITMASNRIPAMPKGVPDPPTSPVLYIAYIGAKQWRKVETAALDEDDVLIIEGHPTLGDDHIVVYATSASSKKLQQAQREKQQAAIAGA